MPLSLKRVLLILVFIALMSLPAGCGASTPSGAPVAATDTTAPVTATVPPSATAAPPTITPTQSAPAEQWQTSDAGAIQFTPNSTGWYTNGDLAPNGAIRFNLTALKGQQMTLWLATEPSSLETPLAFLWLATAAGEEVTRSPELYVSLVLPRDEQYRLEVRSLAQEPITYTLRVEIPAAVIDPANGDVYDPIDPSLCQMLQSTATEQMALDFQMQPRAPFLDVVGGEAGQGCRLSATTDGTVFANAEEALAAVRGSLGLGWTEQPAYQAGGPSGAATGLVRDMGLMLASVQWSPAMGTSCPEDKPLAECELAPEQKIYTVQVDIAQYRADFSLDGQWVDEATGFTLKLGQEWKNIYGGHEVVVRNGAKIDSLDDSISGVLDGKTARVQFQSSFSPTAGTAELTYIDPQTMKWKIVAAPEGEYYLPAEATLTRK